jgi:hypothetical protein
MLHFADFLAVLNHFVCRIAYVDHQLRVPGDEPMVE